MIKISNRLKSLANYIFDDDLVIDVGCDHAILDIYLVQKGVVDKIYVCDVNPNALQNGKENIEKYELSKNIFPILSYGIEKISDLDVNTVVISGMGSKNIIDILSSPNLDKIDKLVLQSNNNHNDLRRFLISKGFAILHEEIIPDGKKTYINIICARDRNIKPLSEIEYEFGPYLIHDEKNLDYFVGLEKNLEDIYFASHTDEAKAKLDMVKTIINNLKNKSYES